MSRLAGSPSPAGVGDDDYADVFGQVARMLLAGWAAQKRIARDLAEASPQECRLCGRWGYRAVDAAEQSAASRLSGPSGGPRLEGWSIASQRWRNRRGQYE